MDAQKKTPIRVRFAPSPTGHLHVGGLRAALFNYFFAKSQGGTYLLRIEDTDVARSKQEYVDSILASFAWTNLLPDEPILYQMSRLNEHKKAAQRLLEEGKAYRCFCPPTNTDLVQEQLEAGIASQYPGTCRTFIPSETDLQKPHAIRFKLEKKEEKISFNDLIRGTLSFDYEQFDDFVIVRQDGIPTYNFVVVLDDIFMQITHVIRGEDHINNTPKQIFLYEALSANIPLFAHLPMILSPQGGRLSKRDGAVSVVDYKKEGYLAPALCNYLMRLGWAHKDQEIFSRDEITNLFSLQDVNKSGAMYDNQKLKWVNSVYIKKLTDQELLHACMDVSVEQTNRLKQFWNDAFLPLLALYKERVSTIKELIEQLEQLATEPTLDTKHFDAHLFSSTTKKLLSRFLDALIPLSNRWQEDTITTAGKEILTKENLKMPALGIPLRIALTGTSNSPGIFHLLALVPHTMAIQRINAYLAACEE